MTVALADRLLEVLIEVIALLVARLLDVTETEDVPDGREEGLMIGTDVVNEIGGEGVAGIVAVTVAVDPPGKVVVIVITPLLN